MGLDISPGGAQWAYGGFMDFRQKLAEAEGFDLRDMAGFTDDGKPWNEVKTPLVFLLNHSDCDGHIESWECEEMIPRLKQIVEGWPDEPEFWHHKNSGKRLIEGMEHCVEHGCAMSFH